VPFDSTRFIVFELALWAAIEALPSLDADADRSYTKADLSPSSIGDAEPVADHVR